MINNFIEDVYQLTNIKLNDTQKEMFMIYYKYLIEYNKHTNLTSITELNEVYFKHFYDSLTLYNEIKDNSSILDIGSGAGFPSIPLKILKNDLKVTIVDSLNKRIIFLKNLINKLNLSNIETFHERAEIFTLKNSNKFDYITARAFGSISLILEIGSPALKIGGKALIMKASSYEEELAESSLAIKKLKCSIQNVNLINLPYNYGKRSIIIIKKEENVKGYPRSFKQMKEKPL